MGEYKQTNKQLSRFSVCTESSSMFFVTAPCMYRITHGASSILKLNANMWLNIKAIDFMRGLKRKFVRSVDSFKLNANAECQCWYFGCCCCFGFAQLSRLPNTNSALFVWFHWNENIWATYVQAHTVNVSLSLYLFCSLFSNRHPFKINSCFCYVCMCHCHLISEYVRKFPFINKRYLIGNQINVHTLRGLFSSYAIHRKKLER